MLLVRLDLKMVSFLCREIYEFEKDTSELIAIADDKRINKKLVMWCDSAEPDRIKMWRKAGYHAEPVVKEPRSVSAQIDYLKQMRIHIHPSCTNTIKGNSAMEMEKG